MNGYPPAHAADLTRSESSAARIDRRPDDRGLTVHHWVEQERRRSHMIVRVVSLADLTGWRFDPDSGTISHHTGRFFSIDGLDVTIPDRAVPHWSQPIIHQSEVGILGILVKRLDGSTYCLMQAKAEPGNRNGIQVSPTVQATRSNYSGVHGGKPVPYLAYFQAPGRQRVLADVRQSEQGAWFYRKRNRNVVIEVDDDVEAQDGFRWLPVAQVHRLLRFDDLVNMDARTVLSCLPLGGPELLGPVDGEQSDPFRSALARSYRPGTHARHTTGEILNWLTNVRARAEVTAAPVPLASLPDWHRTDDRISHRSGHFFDIVGVDVRAGNREVGGWQQPMLRAHGVGVSAFLVNRLDGVLHVLAHARVEPGLVDVAELAPTVQYTPDNFPYLPREAQPLFLDHVLDATPEQIRFDAVLSEEGGRFFDTRCRYLIIETDEPLGHPDYRWMTLHQFTELLRHSYYVNVQARSLLACLNSLVQP
ncbi:NDP-hexose 2,3-dehydratase family protein [Micromonospora sp. STR1_7]|uniref:NDP-hexose 2,3-dehydratase family protein n=1 Tax=Micromonospora parastrephiae TaxID=2806101 RepID=A0ABS1XQ74_9ACTN|nr:NDP-hexose 2,3-dehydratase family protein [Micromonospora parastrephiae]MBM0231407.1 NDP-hexose 2,3-dehydratase family protein [Micromonospora parastrephiae]